MRGRRTASLIALAALVAVGCGQGNAALDTGAKTNAGQRQFLVVTTCGMVTDIVRNVAGDKAKVVGLMGEGVDPHLYKPTRNDVKRLLDADVVFYSGLMLEGRMADTFSKVGRQGKPVFAVTEELDRTLLREPPEFRGHWDPHVWMDVSLWSQCVGFVADALSEFDPANGTFYAQNAKRYRDQLVALHEYAEQAIATIPERQRVLVTAHDAFGYFGRAYGIQVEAVQGVSTVSAAGINDVTRLIDFIVQRKLDAIFVESSVSKKNIEALIQGAQNRKPSWNVEIGGKLFSDAMGPPGTYEGTYIGMIDHNVTTIVRALGGKAPKTGMQEKLGSGETN